MRTTLVSIPTDTQPLDGAYHEPAEEFQKRAGASCAVEIVTDGNHFYTGREDAVAASVSSWLVRTLGFGP